MIIFYILEVEWIIVFHVGQNLHQVILSHSFCLAIQFEINVL